MTKREFFVKALTLINDEEMVDFINAEIIALDKKNEKAKEKRMELAKENAPIFEGIVNYLKDHKLALASELAQVCEVSTPKAVAMAKKLVECGTLVEKEVSIPKVGKRKAYSLAE